MQDANIHNYPIGVDHDYVPICSMLIFRGVVGIRLFGTFWQLASLWNGRDLRNKMQLAGWTCFEGKKTHTSGSIASQWFFILQFFLSSERLEVSLGSYQSMSVVIASRSAKNILESWSWKSAGELPKWIGHDLSASSGIQGQDPIYTPRQGTKKRQGNHHFVSNFE